MTTTPTIRTLTLISLLVFAFVFVAATGCDMLNSSDDETDGDLEAEVESADGDPEAESEPDDEADMPPRCLCTCGWAGDNFEDGEFSDWEWKDEPAYSQVVVDRETAADNSAYSLRLDRGDTAATELPDGLYRTFTPCMPCEISFWIYMETCPDHGAQNRVIGQDRNQNYLFDFRVAAREDGSWLTLVTNTDESQYTDIVVCEEKQWMHVQLFPDWDMGLFLVFVDGNLAARDVPFFDNPGLAIHIARMDLFHDQPGASGRFDEILLPVPCETDGDVDGDNSPPDGDEPDTDGDFVPPDGDTDREIDDSIDPGDMDWEITDGDEDLPTDGDEDIPADGDSEIAEEEWDLEGECDDTIVCCADGGFSCQVAACPRACIEDMDGTPKDTLACVSGVCPCPEDSHEPNNTATNATPLTISSEVGTGEGAICGNIDLWKIDMNVGDSARVYLTRHHGNLGDISDFWWATPTDFGELYPLSPVTREDDNVWSVEIDPISRNEFMDNYTGTIIFAAPYGSGITYAYTLTVYRFPCTPDRFEPNQYSGQGASFALGTASNLRLCADERDVFSLPNLPAGQKARVIVEWSPGLYPDAAIGMGLSANLPARTLIDTNGAQQPVNGRLERTSDVVNGEHSGMELILQATGDVNPEYSLTVTYEAAR